MIDIVVQEIDSPGTDDGPWRRILDVLDHNPFGEFTEMSCEGALEWSPYAINEALKALGRRKKSSVELRTEQPSPLDASISKNPLQNTVRVAFHKADYPMDDEIRLVLSFTKQLTGCFPRLHWGACYSDPGIGGFYDMKDLPWVPRCFMDYLAWVHLVSPAGYVPWFDRETLLTMPAYDVQESEDGVIQIMTYKDPLAFASEENRQRIVDLTEYLNARRKDWK